LLTDDLRTLSLGEVVRRMSQGNVVYSQQIMERYFQLSDLALTPRELDVLGMAAQGLSNGEIARQLCVSPVTVRNHLSNIYAKLDVPQEAGVNSRVYAINSARHLGLARPGVATDAGSPPGVNDSRESVQHGHT
jgi:DNA-binding NarL/FixJ family response regulator